MEIHEDAPCLRDALAAYDYGGQLVGAVRYGQGHINDTYAVYCQMSDGSAKRFILQRINQFVFKKPVEVMENILGVTQCLGEKIAAAGGNPERECLQVLPERGGRFWYIAPDGGVWRLYPFIENTVSYQKAGSAEVFVAAARAFGRFAADLRDYPADSLHSTIPHFHDTPKRFAALLAAIRADKAGRVGACRAEIDFVLAREADCRVLVDQLEQGLLPLRVTHNDTKLNNVLIDPELGEGVCVIDLDTVMPGLWAYDFGDAIRFGASTAAEDEPDLSKVRLDVELYQKYLTAFLETAGSALIDAERASLPWGARLMCLECGMRFLTDYLDGDVYFKTHRPGHNLDRCRAQLKLVREIEACWDELV